MLLGKKILAVVPARGGSKGIKLKNLIKLGGRSLIEWVAACVKNCTILDYTVVSTDHPEIRSHAESVGLKCPFIRPDELSGDRVADAPVLSHALRAVESILGVDYDVVVMLQPTSPFRTSEHITSVCRKLIEENLDSVLTISKSDPKAHPLKQLFFENNRVEYFDNAGKSIVARQQLSDLYFRNGLVYAMTRDCLLGKNSVIGENASAIVIEDRVINIDSQEDVEFGEYLLEKGLVLQGVSDEEGIAREAKLAEKL
jgi:CMP-N,N'-diacetyllegionaminic acid synthase